MCKYEDVQMEFLNKGIKECLYLAYSHYFTK